MKLAEKILAKIEIKDARLRVEIEETLKTGDYDICPYIVRIYDFINIARQNNSDSSRELAVQCLYEGTVYEAKTKCLKIYSDCKRYKTLLRHEELMGNNKEDEK